VEETFFTTSSNGFEDVVKNVEETFFTTSSNGFEDVVKKEKPFFFLTFYLLLTYLIFS
jgi:hypothetical protein